MKKIIVCLFMIISQIYIYAQYSNHSILGENYTYIRFDIEQRNNYSIFFDAVTKKDSINVDLSNLNKFTESVFSSCFFEPLTNDASIKAFQDVYGNAISGSPTEIYMQLYNWEMQFHIDFFDKFAKFKRVTNLQLQSGETVHIEYFDVTGIFYRGDKSFISISNISDGLPANLMTMDTAIIPVAMTDYGTTKEVLKFKMID